MLLAAVIIGALSQVPADRVGGDAALSPLAHTSGTRTDWVTLELPMKPLEVLCVKRPLGETVCSLSVKEQWVVVNGPGLVGLISCNDKGRLGRVEWPDGADLYYIVPVTPNRGFGFWDVVCSAVREQNTEANHDGEP